MPHPQAVRRVSSQRRGLASMLCQGPRAAVTNGREPASLEQHGFVVSQCWRSEVSNGSYRAKVKVSTALCSSRRPQEKLPLVPA